VRPARSRSSYSSRVHDPTREPLTLLRRGETQAAIALLDSMAAAPALAGVRARSLLAWGDLAAAKGLAWEVVAERPSDWNALLTLATSAVRQSRIGEADALIQRLERSHDGGPGRRVDVVLLRNEWLGQTDRLVEVVPRSERTLVHVDGCEPEATILRLALATEYRRNGRHTDAMALLERVAETLQVHDWPGLEGRWQATRCAFPAPGESLEEQVGWLRQGIERLREVGDHSRVVVLLNNLGSRLLALGRLEEAEQVFAEGAEAADPRHAPYLLSGRYESLWRLGRFDEADGLLEELLAHPLGPARNQLHVRTANLSRVARRRDWGAFDRDLASTLGYLRAPPAQTLLWLAAVAAEESAGEGQLAGAACVAAAAWEGQHATGDAVRSVEAEQRIRRLADRGAPVVLLPYVLLEPIGRGGMGSVWRARHLPTGELRAVKTVPPAAGGVAEAALAREVRALSTLGHPHVVPILDHGTASPPTEWSSRGAIAAGSAWIAMPLARRSLSDLCGRMPWDAARTVLLAVLDALATAHAHGLLHLDVKPANILVDGDEPPYVAMLADFGLARPERERDRTVAGTPDYMAPEQFRRVWREWGPWTDLYALGATAVTLVQGRAPFGGASGSDLAAAHLQAPLPPLRPAVDVPSGLEGWIARMMAKDPVDRFPTAASAAAALAALGPAEPVSERGLAPMVDPQCTFEWVDIDEGALPAPDPSGEEVPPDWPDVPGDWRTEVLTRQSGSPSLLAHRQVQVHGRDAERDLLWTALQDVQASRRPRVVLLRGSRGSGTGRLLEWLSVRVACLGVGRVVHTTVDVPHGLRALFRAEDAEGPELLRHLLATARRPPHLDVDQLVAALTTDAPEACVSVLSALGRVAPLVLLIPGARRPHAVLDVVERLLDADGRVLVVMGLRDDEAFAHPAVAERGQRATPHPRWTVHRVPPMGAVELRQVVRSMVELEPALLERLVVRSRGNPGYAVSLVRAWRTFLSEGPDGLRVPEHIELRPPPGLERWLDLLSSVEVALRRALEVLAVLWEATPTVWGAACRHAGVPWDVSVPGRAMAAGLVEERKGRLLLASPVLSDALLRDLEVAGRWVRLHDAAAAALAGSGPGETQARRGRHLVAAGRAGEAVAPLHEACMVDVEKAFERGWLQELERALHAACVPDSDPRWLDALAGLLDHHYVRSQVHGVRERLPRYARLGADEPRHRWRAQLLSVLLADGASPGGLESLWHDLPDDGARRRVVQEAAWRALHHGDLEEASKWLDRVDDATDPLLLELRSELERRRGRLPRALELAEAAAGSVRDAQPLSAAIWSHLGDLRRDAGRPAEAANAYRRSLRLARERGDDQQAAVVELNLLLLRLGAGSPVPRAEVLAVRRGLRGGSRDALLASELLGLLVAPDDELTEAVEHLLADLPRGHPELTSIARVVAGARRHEAVDRLVDALSKTSS